MAGVNRRRLEGVKEIATPANPDAGFEFLYPKADGRWYGLTSAGVETCVMLVGYVNHGAVAGTARPNFAMVIWRGTVQPTNMTGEDLWVDTS